jgi:CDP-glucose 4,6-dehydratase
MTTSFWHGRKVLITGHTGFKGSWLSLWLARLGARPIGFALEPPTNPSLFETARVREGMIDIRGDVRDRGALRATVARYEPEIVFHLAAQPLVRQSYAGPVETFAANVMGTVHLLDAVRQTPIVQTVVVVTSDKCYLNKEWHWGYREDEPMGGHDPYSASKGCAELVTAAFRQSYFSADGRVGLATARAGNVIGGGDWARDRIVPDAVRALSRGETFVARRPAAVRPWQHVLEPLAGYLTLAERLHAEPRQYSEAWNFGPHDEDSVPVAELLDRFIAHWGEGAWRGELVASGPHEAHLLRLDSSKARERLDWRVALGLDETVRLTAEWYRAACRTASATDVRDLTNAQIEHYEKQAAARASERSKIVAQQQPARHRQAA